MKRLSLLLCWLLLLSGCATYKFQKGGSSYGNGYVVLRDKKLIPEYTLGQQNSTPPDMDLAKERFKRRRSQVEYYYKKMGTIQSRAKEMFWEPPVFFVNFVTGFFRLPFIAIKDRRYARDASYRQKIDQQQEQQFAREEEVKKRYKEQLGLFIKKDLEKEGFAQPQPAPASPAVEARPEVQKVVTVVPVEAPVAVVQPAPVPATEAQTPKEEVISEKVMPPAVEEKQVVKMLPQEPIKAPVQKPAPAVKKAKEKKVIKEPVAVIVARPQKGYSPLTVHFSGSRSHAPSGTIIAYEWDFGDGDLSTKRNPVNTYWSTSYGSKIFTAKLTVTDSNGNSAVSTVAIEVMTK